jgi:hypothetical protein
MLVAAVPSDGRSSCDPAPPHEAHETSTNLRPASVGMGSIEVEKGDVDWPKLESLQRFAAEHPEYELRVIDAVAA